MNEEQTVRFRRYSKNVVSGGSAVILLSVWTLIKTLIIVVQNWDALLKETGLEEISQEWVQVTVGLVLVGIYAVIVLVHVGLGISAIRYGRGKKKKRWFLILAVLLLALTVFGMPSYFREYDTTVQDTSIAAFLADATTIFVLIDLIYSSIRMKQLENQTA